MTALTLAFLAGVLTTLNPCVLPLLPLVIGGAFAQGRLGPFFLASGMVVSFTSFGVLLSALGHGIGLDQSAIRIGAALLLLMVGVLLVNRPAQDAFARLTAPLSSGANAALNRFSLAGNHGQFALGALLGAVWTPCVGPTLGAAMALAAQGENLVQITLTMGIFSLGMASVFLAIAYTTRGVLAKKKGGLAAFSARVRPIFGWLLVGVGLLILSGFDKLLEVALLRAMPDWLIELTTRF